jgi:AraC-like DNA-binding protein
MSPRNFAHPYKTKTGRMPAKAVDVLRLEAARRLLEETEQGVARIARSFGFGDEERMRATSSVIWRFRRGTIGGFSIRSPTVVANELQEN